MTVRFYLVWLIAILTVWFRATLALSSTANHRRKDKMTPEVDRHTYRTDVC